MIIQQTGDFSLYRKAPKNYRKGSIMNKINYQKELEKIIAGHIRENKIPTLLIHSCCAPCSSYVLEYLSRYFRITVLYYNPNIFPESEYMYRIAEQERLINAMPFIHPVNFLSTEYTPEDFYSVAKGMESVKEGGERCFRCYRLRLEYAAKTARELGFDYFTTTLSISPLKNAEKLNEIGLALEQEYQVTYLVSDFKKKNGYKRSVELSAEYGLYRQNYCGCIYSKKEMEDCEKSTCK